MPPFRTPLALQTDVNYTVCGRTLVLRLSPDLAVLSRVVRVISVLATVYMRRRSSVSYKRSVPFVRLARTQYY